MRPSEFERVSRAILVQIHPPRVGCDLNRALLEEHEDVSIHAPREGCDSDGMPRVRAVTTFQFTHPGRGATASKDDVRGASGFQFTHPGRGATPFPVRYVKPSESFNSRTPGGVRQHNANHSV